LTAWRLVLGGGDALVPLPGAFNMAVDAALFEAVQRGAAPVLRFYLWQPACLSLGRNQPARDSYDPAIAAAAGVDIVRRPTGGLAVLHDAELTYAVIAPVAVIGRPRAAYARINLLLADALRRLGVAAAPAAAGAAAGRLDGVPPPCFDVPAQGELVAGGGKLVGSAQRVERGALLQHGSILLDGSQLRVRSFERRTAPATTATGAGGTTLRALLGRAPAPDEVAAAAAAAFGAARGIALAPGTLDPRERSRARELEQDFRSASWTWRR
jgi:lipoyl(octanoyl) transferase